MYKLRSFLKRSRAFTLVELLIVIVVLAVLAAIVIPKFNDSGTRGRESSLRANLKVVRNAVELFKTDTGSYPAALTDLAATTAPANGKDSTGTQKSITAADYKGPYVAEVPNDTISGSAMTYSVTSGSVGKVSSSATGNDTAGVAYSTY